MLGVYVSHIFEHEGFALGTAAAVEVADLVFGRLNGFQAIVADERSVWVCW